MVFSKYFDQVAHRNASSSLLSSSDREIGSSIAVNSGDKASSGIDIEASHSLSKTTPSSNKKQDTNNKKQGASNKKQDKSNKKNVEEEVLESNNRGGRKRRRSDQSSSRGIVAQNGSSRRSKPSLEALELSQRLMELSKRKNLAQALTLFWEKENENIRDAHHACIVVDCCARCGDVYQAEDVLRAIPSDMARSIELQTALIKGYAHAGDMHNAMRVYLSLFAEDKNRREKRYDNKRPNVRTLNTLLRGSLWTAAMPSSKQIGGGSEFKKDDIAGGVVSSEDAFETFMRHSTEQIQPDASSFESTISLLCQSFRIEAAQARIEIYQRQFNIRIKGKASIKAETPDQSTFETLAAVYLCLARANAMIGNWDHVWDACQRSMHALQASRHHLEDGDSGQEIQETQSARKKGKSTSGGKRAWKRGSGTVDGQTDHRNTSNLMYREHRLNEMELELKSLLNIRRETKDQTISSLHRLRSHLTSKLFYFGGGGSTELSTKSEQNKSNATKQTATTFASIIPNWLSFGLCEVHRRMGLPVENSNPPDSVLQSFLTCFDKVGHLRTDQIFGGESSQPLDVELGAGFGDWIVQQAKCHPKRNYIAVELRADRVHQMFAKAMLQSGEPLPNLCVVGAEAGDFLRYRLCDGLISTVFVNHPEPPTQTFGEANVDLNLVESGKDEPAHMLCSANLKVCFACLRPGGRLIVVTDNKWYARLVCATLVRLSRELKSIGSLDQAMLAKHGFREVETFRKNITIFEGQPNKAIGHAEERSSQQGSSYFDRLWRTGTSGHAHKTSRFVVGIVRMK